MITIAEVKDVLRITSSTYDSDIAFFIPLVKEDIIEYLGHAFQDGYVYRESWSDFAFVRGDSDTYDYITDDEEEFLEKGFAADMDIVIEGGYANVGLYTIDSASSGTLKLTEYGTLINQDQDDTSDDNYIGQVRISRVKWPKGIKLAAAKMIWHLIDDAKPSGALSERLDDYSITYAGAHAYPVQVLDLLNRYRKVKLL